MISATWPNPLGPAYRASGAWLERPLGELFAATTDRRRRQAALIDAERTLKFGELFALVERVADGLLGLGVQPGDVVAYQLPNWWETAVIFLAAVRVGATVNPLLPSFRAAELRFTLQQSGASVLFIPGLYRNCDHRRLIDGLRGDLPALGKVVVVRDTPGADSSKFAALVQRLAPDAQRPTPLVDADRIALLMYTSGSTGLPKGVLHTHNSLAAEVFSLQRVHDLGPDDRTLMPSPLTHISGVIHGILAPALLGTSAVLMDRWDAARAVELIETERVTYMVGAPTFLQDLLAQPAADTADLGSLRLFSCGGASVSPALVEEARRRLPDCVTKRVYGSTEFPTLTTTSAADALTHGMDTEGRAIAPAEVRVADAAGVVLPVGAEGEVQGRGPECFAGYADAQLNADSFTADGWFRSGDLGVLDADGYLRITGRLKDIVIRKGEKISVREVEEVIALHPAVLEVVVVGLPDPDSGERACAALRLRPGATLDLAALTEFLATHGLAKPKWPERLVIVDDFPRTESGKVVRPSLRERLQRDT